MRKLDLIIEGIRDEYMINLLEEGSVSELESLKTKKFLNENLNRIRKMLVEEGALDGVKQHLGNNWGKYLGAGAAGLGAAGLADLGDIPSHIADYANNADSTIGGTLGSIGNRMADNVSGAYNDASGAIGDAYNKADLKAGGWLPGARTPGEADSYNAVANMTADATPENEAAALQDMHARQSAAGGKDFSGNFGAAQGATGGGQVLTDAPAAQVSAGGGYGDAGQMARDLGMGPADAANPTGTTLSPAELAASNAANAGIAQDTPLGSPARVNQSNYLNSLIGNR